MDMPHGTNAWLEKMSRVLEISPRVGGEEPLPDIGPGGMPDDMDARGDELPVFHGPPGQDNPPPSTCGSFKLEGTSASAEVNAGKSNMPTVDIDVDVDVDVDVDLPDFELPDFEFPDFELPDFELPSAPEEELPSLEELEEYWPKAKEVGSEVWTVSSNSVSILGEAMGPVGTAFDIVGAGLGVFKIGSAVADGLDDDDIVDSEGNTTGEGFTNDEYLDIVEGNTDIVASVGSIFGGPVGWAGSAGYAVGNLITNYAIDPYLNRPHTEDASDYGKSFEPGKPYNPADDHVWWHEKQIEGVKEAYEDISNRVKEEYEYVDNKLDEFGDQVDQYVDEQVDAAEEYIDEKVEEVEEYVEEAEEYVEEKVIEAEEYVEEKTSEAMEFLDDLNPF